MEACDLGQLRVKNAYLKDVANGPGGHHTDLGALADGASKQPHVRDHALVGVVGGIENQGPKGLSLALWGRHPLHDCLQELSDSPAVLRGHKEYLVLHETECLLKLLRHALGPGNRQVYLIYDRDDGQIVLQGEVDVCEGLGLNALGGVHNQQRAFAGSQGAGDLVAEVHVTGRVDEVELVVAVAIGVGHPDGLALDGNAALALQVHLVHELLRHVTGADGSRDLQDAVCQGGLAVVYVGNDAEIADSISVHTQAIVA